MAGIGAPDDHGEMMQGRIVQPVLLQKGIEAAEWPVVRQLDIRYVVGDSACFGGDRKHLVRRDEQELRRLVDEAHDEPRAGDAVDLRAFARDPFHERIPSYAAAFRAGRGTVLPPMACQAAMPPLTTRASIPRARNSVTARSEE